MKTLLMKLCSLLVLALGALLLAWALRLTPVTEPLWKYYTEFMSGETVSPMVVQVIAAAVLLVLGFIAFLPSGNPRSLRRAVLVPSEHGQVAVQLDALRPVLLKVLRKMPEVRKVKLAIKPPRGKKKAVVTAFVSLRQQANLDLRQHVDIITQHIAETAVKLLGIANLVDIEVFVDGIKVDAKAAAQAVLASKESFETRLLAQAAPVAAGALAYEAATTNNPAPAETAIQLTATAQEEEVEEDEVAEEVEQDTAEEYDQDEAITEELAEEEEELIASGEELIPAFVESENAPPLPPIDPDALVTPIEATHNAFDSDAGYVLPPMSEQEAALNPKPGDESDPDALEESAIAEHVSDAHESGLELNDPLAEALWEDDEATAIPEGDVSGLEEAEVETIGLEPMDATEPAAGTEGASPSDEEPPLPPEAPRKRWSFF